MTDARTEPGLGPQGAIRQRDGSVVWRLWAPHSERVALVLRRGAVPVEADMEQAGNGYFLHREQQAGQGVRYVYRLDGGPERPDPASRHQPDGVRGPSAVFFPEELIWSDVGWRGVPRSELVIYELHVGTFTPEGTFDAVIPRLPELVELGITAIELMPVAQFPGQRSWGYDGVHLYTVQNSYGGPWGLNRLVDAAHRAGIAVILDVVYNHLGLEGNYFGEFGPYFADRYRTPWGPALNFDGPECDPVRQFVIENACMWVCDYHLDGLRLDAADNIFDLSARHILADIQQAVQREAAQWGRTVVVIAESSDNDVRLMNPPERGGYGLDGVWSDDFHHSVHALLTGERDGYYEDFGRAEHLAKAYNDVFVYDGCYSPFRGRRHGSRVGKIERDLFIVCVQNHDQVGNRARGDRFGTLLPPPAQRLACGLLLLSPCVPLLFMGEEYGETGPFPFFCSYSEPELIEVVRRGRLEQFRDLKFDRESELLDPQEAATFTSAKLTWNWPEGSAHAGLRRLYADLLTARRRWPALRDRQHTAARLIDGGNGGGPHETRALLLLERGMGSSLIACANLTAEVQPWPKLEPGDRRLLLSSESAHYGGSRVPGDDREGLLPYELVIYGPGDCQGVGQAF